MKQRSTPFVALFPAVLVLATVGSHSGRTHPAAQNLRGLSIGAISGEAATTVHTEPWLAINPTDPDNLIATAMMLGPADGGSVIYATHDGGATWHRGLQSSDGARSFPDGDPMVRFGPDGVAYFTTLDRGFAVWRSIDGGRSWERRGQVPGGVYDRQWLTIDGSGGEFHGRLYTAGKFTVRIMSGDTAQTEVVSLSRSDDGGASYDSLRAYTPEPGREFLHIASDLDVGVNGEVLAPFISHFSADATGLLTGRLSMLVSPDGGRRFEGPHEISAHYSFGHARQEQSYKALGGGRIAVDRSGGRFHGRIYIAWVEGIDDRAQIVVAASGDSGRSWSEFVRVNDGGYASNQSNPAIAVSSAGVVAVSWNDRRNDPTDACFQLFAAASVDGGRSFLPNVQIADSFSCPSGRWVNGGDTQGLVGTPDGGFRLAWINTVEGIDQLWFAALDGPARQVSPRDALRSRPRNER